MGAGRKTEAYMFLERTKHQTSINATVKARNLRRNDLAGVVFGCTSNTIAECLSKQLFGLPAPHFSYVEKIRPGLPLFLFNFSDRKLHGIFESASNGQMYIDRYAWTEQGNQRTPFPAQVRVCVQIQCQPLQEKQFRPIIQDNFYSSLYFWFELDHTQVEQLLLLFTPTRNRGMKYDHLNSLLYMQLCGNGTDASTSIIKELPLEEEFKSSCLGDAVAKQFCSLSISSAGDDTDLDRPEAESDAPLEFGSSSMSNCLDAEGQTVDAISDDEEECASEERNADGFVCGDTSVVFTEDVNNLPDSDNLHPDISQLAQELKVLKAFHVEQLQKNIALEKKLTESDLEIQRLRERVQDLEYGYNQCEISADESPSALLDHLQSQSHPEGQIYLMGGFDGFSWLSVLESYSPSADKIEPLAPMNIPRSYAFATALNGDIYLIGGGVNGNTWFDSVECYSPRTDRWTQCPPLIKRKGSLAGATVQSKLFAIGGGNSIETFADVEMFDPVLGRWINNASMLEKRFAPAAGELNGVLYAVGGYNGKEYLSSVERFDPREVSWTRLPSMISRRGCHSLAVLDEKIYAIGGFDGLETVSTVEVFDPRAGSWISGDSMKYCRGYAATAVLGGSIYIIGGMFDGFLSHTVECYKEGFGWLETNLKAVGKRSFFSAIVL